MVKMPHSSCRHMSPHRDPEQPYYSKCERFLDDSGSQTSSLASDRYHPQSRHYYEDDIRQQASWRQHHLNARDQDQRRRRGSRDACHHGSRSESLHRVQPNLGSRPANRIHDPHHQPDYQERHHYKSARRPRLIHHSSDSGGRSLSEPFYSLHSHPPPLQHPRPRPSGHHLLHAHTFPEPRPHSSHSFSEHTFNERPISSSEQLRSTSRSSSPLQPRRLHCHAHGVKGVDNTRPAAKLKDRHSEKKQELFNNRGLYESGLGIGLAGLVAVLDQLDV